MRKGGLRTAERVVLPEKVAQATLRLSSDSECERVISLAHRRDIASAMAYGGPEEAESPIFVLIIDEVENVEEFLPELQMTVPGVRVSVIREDVVHLAPPDFLRGGAIRPGRFRAEMEHLWWVFAGGALGAGARILTETGARYVDPGHAAFPWGTMAVNVSGSFAIAILGTLIAERFVEERSRMFWVLGFLGSFTTFSSYVFQTSESWRASALLGGLYGGGSMVLGLAAALFGIWLTRRLLKWQ